MKKTNAIHDLGVNTAKLRNEKGYTQEQLVEKIGDEKISVSTISRLERGLSGSVKKLNLICEALECEIGDLLSSDWVLKDCDGQGGMPFNVPNSIIDARSTFIIKTIKPLSLNKTFMEIPIDAKLMVRQYKKKGITDKRAQIDFWETVLNSGVLAAPCDALEIKITSDAPQHDNKFTLHPFMQMTDDLIWEETVCESRFGAVDKWVGTRIDLGCTINTAGTLKIYFKDATERKEFQIQTLVDEWKKKLAEAKTFIRDNPDGFTFLVCSGSVHDGALDFSQYATGALPIQLINAWTEEDAKKKYLKINETQRMYDFYLYDFEDEFAGYVLWGDIYEITTSLKNGENIKKTADRILKYLFPENKVYSIDMEEGYRLKESIKNNYSNDKLFELFGIEDFLSFWLCCEMNNVEARLSVDQEELQNYVFSVL